MHDSIRAKHEARQGQAFFASALAALICVAAVAGVPRPSLAASSTASIDPKANALPVGGGVPHEIRIGSAEPGAETLELSAKLTEDGGSIRRPIAWKLHREGGETIFSGSMPVARLAAEPGDYVVEARYGSVQVAQNITLLARQRIGVTFILNVGGIRVLSRLTGIDVPPARPLTLVYAASGPDRGKLITISERPGEIMRLAAGTYRVESRFPSGNATAVADVIVKPGLLSSVEINHRAGIVRLPGGGETGRLSWTISDGKGHNVAIESASDVVLTPGSYVARARIGSEDRIVPFIMDAGKQIDVGAR